MKIHLLNPSKLKIIFNLKDLEENNISLHSFLSGSENSITFLKAIIEIAHEDFGFNIVNQEFSYETFSFNHSKFIIIVSSEKSSNYSIHNFKDISTQNTFRDNTSSNNSFSFIDNQLSNFILSKKNIYYAFDDLEHFFEFSNYAKVFLKHLKVDSSLYEYNNIFLLEILVNNLSDFELKRLFLIFSELKTNFYSSDIVITRFKEFGKLVMHNNALQL